MTITRFPRPPHRAIYIRHGANGWFCYVAGYTPAARDTPKVTQRSYAERAEAEAAARALGRRCGLPIVGAA